MPPLCHRQKRSSREETAGGEAKQDRLFPASAAFRGPSVPPLCQSDRRPDISHWVSSRAIGLVPLLAATSSSSSRSSSWEPEGCHTCQPATADIYTYALPALGFLYSVQGGVFACLHTNGRGYNRQERLGTTSTSGRRRLQILGSSSPLR